MMIYGPTERCNDANATNHPQEGGEAPRGRALTWVIRDYKMGDWLTIQTMH